jgi:hypothetical protein
MCVCVWCYRVAVMVPQESSGNAWISSCEVAFHTHTHTHTHVHTHIHNHAHTHVHVHKMKDKVPQESSGNALMSSCEVASIMLIMLSLNSTCKCHKCEFSYWLTRKQKHQMKPNRLNTKILKKKNEWQSARLLFANNAGHEDTLARIECICDYTARIDLACHGEIHSNHLGWLRV